MNRQMRRAGHDYRIRMLGGEWATNMTCREANCEAYRKGWFCVLDVSTDTGAAQATWIKERSHRRLWQWASADALEEALRLEASGEFTVTPPLRSMLAGLAPGLQVFCFPPGQTCFKEHTDREVVFKHNDYTHVKPREWNEDFNEQADRVNTALKRG